jgi:hypothetical protein
MHTVKLLRRTLQSYSFFIAPIGNMVRRSSISFIHLVGLMMLISSSTSSETTILALEEKLHKLTENFVIQFYL